MQIESIKIQNYRTFRHAHLDGLPRLVTLVGANGTGKSTLFDVFSFLKDALAHNVGKAVARRGSMRELRSRDQRGPIRIEIKFRESGGRLATYELAFDELDGRVFIEREVLKYRRGQEGRPWHFVDFQRGTGTAITNESAYGLASTDEQCAVFALDEPDVLAIKGLGQFKEFRVVAEFRSLIENWQISDFHIADARPSTEEGFAEHLSTRGDNLAQVAQYLHQYHPERFQAVLEAMERRVPGISHIEAKRNPRKTAAWSCAFRTGNSTIPSSPVSSPTAPSRCSPTWSCCRIPGRFRYWPSRNPRTSSIPICCRNWPRNSEAMPVVVARSSFPRTPQIS